MGFFPRVSIYSRADKSLYCVTCQTHSNSNMERVGHLQSEEHMTKLYKYKGNKEQKRMRREGYVKKERKNSDDESKKEVEGENDSKDKDDNDRERSKSRKRSKKDKKRHKKDKRKKKKKKRYYSSSSD